MHSLGSLGQQRHMRIGTPSGHVVTGLLLFQSPPLHFRGVETRSSRSDIGFQADNGFNPGIMTFLIKLKSPEQVTMIGDRHGLLLVFYRFGDQPLNLCRPIQNRVVSVDMKMDEIGFGHGLILVDFCLVKLRSPSLPGGDASREFQPNY